MLKGKKRGKLILKIMGVRKIGFQEVILIQFLQKIPVVSPYFYNEPAAVSGSNINDLNLAVEKSKSILPYWSKLNVRDRAVGKKFYSSSGITAPH